MCHQISNAENIEAGALLASVALFHVCYGCFIMPRSGPGGLPRIIIGLGVCTLFLLAVTILAIAFGLARKGFLPGTIAFPCFFAWKESAIWAVNSLEFHEILGGLIRSYGEDCGVEQYSVLGATMILQVISVATAVWLLLHLHLEFIWGGPIVTHLCIALLAIRFTAMLKSPTPSVRQGLCTIAIVAALASVIATILLFGRYLGWISHEVAFQCAICVAVLLVRPASLAWAKLRRRLSEEDKSALEIQQPGSI